MEAKINHCKCGEKKQKNLIFDVMPKFYSLAETLNLLIGRTSIEWSSQIARHQQAF